MSAREARYACAIVLGVIFEAVFFWKFRPYSTREHGPDLFPWYTLPILAFLAGLLLTVGLDGKKRWIPTAMFAAFCVANACLIVADCSVDPTNHNLWPFEFVIIALATAPSYLGAGVSVLIDRARNQQK